MLAAVPQTVRIRGFHAIARVPAQHPEAFPLATHVLPFFNMVRVRLDVRRMIAMDPPLAVTNFLIPI